MGKYSSTSVGQHMGWGLSNRTSVGWLEDEGAGGLQQYQCGVTGQCGGWKTGGRVQQYQHGVAGG